MQQLQRQIARVIYFTGFIYFSFIHKKLHCLIAYILQLSGSQASIYINFFV